MNKLSETSRNALSQAFATRGKHAGSLLARCPLSHTVAAAAWQGAMLSINPFKASIAAMLFMSEEQHKVRDEVVRFFDALPRATRVAVERDRRALDMLGVW